MYGYWGKVLMIVNLAIGCIAPPVGLDLFCGFRYYRYSDRENIKSGFSLYRSSGH